MSAWPRATLLAALRTWAVLAVGLGLPAVAVELTASRSTLRLATSFLVTCALVMALQTFVGNSGIVSFGHVSFLGLGAYAAALLTIPAALKPEVLPQLPFGLQQVELGLAPAVVASGLLAGLLALVTGLALTRMQETAMAMATLALLVMAHTVFANWETVTRGTIGIYGVPQTVSLPVALGGMLGIALLALLYKHSPAGLRLQASRDDPRAAASLGIHVSRVRLGGWVVSALLTGAGGALWAQSNLAFGPDQFFFAETFALLSMLVIGGLQSVSGAVLGAGLVTALGELMRTAEAGFALGPIRVTELPGIVQLTIAVAIILVLVFRPAGLLGRRELDPESLRARRVKR